MPSGAILTLVVDDVYDVTERAVAAGASLVMDPVALDYGMTRAVLRDPTGFVLDISTPTADLGDHPTKRDPDRASIQQPVGRGFEPEGQA